MRLPDSEYTSRPWRIHGITPDFRLEDVWAIRAPGQPDEFRQLIAGFAAFDPGADSSARSVRGLFALRWKLGEWLGWDRERNGLGERVDSLTDRLPAELRAHGGPAIQGTPFRSLYQLDNEFAAEIANRTMHGVIHLGWVPDRREAQMTVLVGYGQTPQPPPRAAGELLSGRFRALKRAGDVGEWHAEDVVEHKRQSLGRSELLEHHEQRETNRLGQQHVVLRIVRLIEAHHGVRNVDRGLFGPGPARAQSIQSYPSDDRGQPGLHVLDVLRVRIADPKPRLLDSVVRFTHRAEHPIGNSAEMRPVQLKPLSQPFALIHHQLTTTPPNPHQRWW